MRDNSVIQTKDYYDFKDIYSIDNKNSKLFDSLVVIRDKKTKKILYVGKNRSMLSAAEHFARTSFFQSNDDTNWEYKTPTYNSKLELTGKKDITEIDNFNDSKYKICLFCIGNTQNTSGTTEATARDVWIKPLNLIPFRYVNSDNLTNNELYFGKKEDSSVTKLTRYYFKAIDKNSIKITKLKNNTEWTGDIYSDSIDEQSILSSPQVIVTCDMEITEIEGIEYYSNIGYNLNRVFNCLSLCLGYPIYGDNNTVTEYIGIRCFTRINFADKLLDGNSSYKISYSIYF